MIDGPNQTNFIAVNQLQQKCVCSAKAKLEMQFDLFTKRVASTSKQKIKLNCIKLSTAGGGCGLIFYGCTKLQNCLV